MVLAVLGFGAGFSLCTRESSSRLPEVRGWWIRWEQFEGWIEFGGYITIYLLCGVYFSVNWYKEP